MIDSKWRTVKCPSCNGGGIVADYGGGCDFEGAKDCPECSCGQLFIRPSGHVFLYPGGPAMGRWEKSDYEEGTPVEPDPDPWELLDEAHQELERLETEAARYRAALQEIERVAFRVTEGPDPDGDLVTYCQWCRMADRGRVQHRDWCAVTIAHRALHPEEGEG